MGVSSTSHLWLATSRCQSKIKVACREFASFLNLHVTLKATYLKDFASEPFVLLQPSSVYEDIEAMDLDSNVGCRWSSDHVGPNILTADGSIRLDSFSCGHLEHVGLYEMMWCSVVNSHLFFVPCKKSGLPYLNLGQQQLGANLGVVHHSHQGFSRIFPQLLWICAIFVFFWIWRTKTNQMQRCNDEIWPCNFCA